MKSGFRLVNGCYPDLARDPDHYEMLILNLQCLRAANPSTPDKKIKQSSGQAQEWESQVLVRLSRCGQWIINNLLTQPSNQTDASNGFRARKPSLGSQFIPIQMKLRQ